MELLTTIPPRTDETVRVSVPQKSGPAKVYVFKGKPGVCDVANEADAEFLLNSGNFMSREDYDEEMAFLAKAAERDARKKGHVPAASAATFVPGEPEDDGGDISTGGTGQAEEAGTKPTGRVRRAGGGQPK